MQPIKKTGPDVVQEIIEDCLLAMPVSSLLISFYKQYAQRGFLTKKQLEGLLAKASSIDGMHPGRLATLAAIIKKMPSRYKSELPTLAAEETVEDIAGPMLTAILEKYPAHKRVLFLKHNHESHQLTSAELEELKRFHKLLVKNL
ncbi:MAG: hypothetical protein EOP49_11315 [Sphingobacteriales bacterium]|nr:MAG: hypothetical protein EOP49_11315 [Sphingobacteriales bacterium]